MCGSASNARRIASDVRSLVANVQHATSANLTFNGYSAYDLAAPVVAVCSIIRIYEGDVEILSDDMGGLVVVERAVKALVVLQINSLPLTNPRIWNPTLREVCRTAESV